jgi:hypothetical protein
MNKLRKKLILFVVMTVLLSTISATQYVRADVGFSYEIVHPSDADIRYIGSDNAPDGLRVLRADSSNSSVSLEFGKWSDNSNKTYTAAFGIVNEESFPVIVNDVSVVMHDGSPDYMQIWLHAQEDMDANSEAVGNAVFMWDRGIDPNNDTWTLGPGNQDSSDASFGLTPWDSASQVRYATGTNSFGAIPGVSDFVWVQISLVIPADVALQKVSGTIIFKFSEVDDISPQPPGYVYAGGWWPAYSLKQYYVSNMTQKAQSASYGGIIYASAVDDTYLYAAGATTNKVFQYYKSNMTKKAETESYEDTIRALAVDSDYVYAAGSTTNKVFQYYKSNMTKKAETESYGGTIFAIAVDDEYVYAGGTSTNKVYQYYKSNMTKKAESAATDTIYAIVVDSSFIYSAGSSFRIHKYQKTDLSTVAQTPSQGAMILTLSQDDNHVYAAGWFPSQNIRKFDKSDLGFIAESPSYGGVIESIATDDNFVYAGGRTTQTVRQYDSSDMSYVGQTISYGANIQSICVE